MRFGNTKSLLRAKKDVFAESPVALIFVEDDVEVAATISHHVQSGFKSVVGFMAPDIELDDALAESFIRVDWDIAQGEPAIGVINACIAAAPGTWFYFCYNAEFLFFPFSETRNVAEMVEFNIEERRDSMLTYVVDLYASNLYEHPSAVSLEDAWMDRSGYYALQRTDEWNNPLDRQMDFYGGLRWRLEEHIPAKRRRIDRISIFKAKPGLELREDHTFNDPEYNTFACPWHHSITAAVCSFRTAKALKRNPGSTFDIDTFRWHNSVKFAWNSRQLMDFGLMEPGQWF